MAKYRITGPDGGTYEITAPDDATQEQVLAYAQANYQQPAQSKALPPQESYDPTDGMSFGEKFAAGAGRSVVETGRGIKQLATESANRTARNVWAGLDGIGADSAARFVFENAGVPLARELKQQQADIAEARRLDAPLMATGAGVAGNIVGGALQAAVPVGGAGAAVGLLGRAAPYAGAAARGAAYAGAQPVVEGESRLGNVAIGGAAGAAGQGLASFASRGAASAKDALAGPMRDSINAARAAGIPLHLSQVTNSTPLKYLSSVAGRLPFAGGGAAAARQASGFNRAVGRTFGVDAPALTDDVMQQARAGIGSVYDDVFSRNQIAMQPGDAVRMQSVVASARRDMTAENAEIIRNQFHRVIDEFASGPMTGAKYQNLRGELADLAGGHGKDSVVGKAIGKIRQTLDDAASRSVGTADAAALKRANAMWANMKTAEDALKQVNGGAAGNVKPASLWPLVRKGSTKEMRELAKVGQNVLRQQLPDSGTADRMFMQNLLGLGGGSVAATSDNPWVKAAGVGLLAGRAINSPLATRGLLAYQPAAAASKQGLARLAAATPYALPAAAHGQMQPRGLEINVVGGTVGPAPTEAEMEELRRRGLIP